MSRNGIRCCGSICRSPIGGAISSMRGSIARCESAIQGGRQREPCVPRPRPPALGVVRVARFLSFTDRRSDLVDEGIDRAVRIGDPGGGSASLA
ncbi:hypothetical protein LV178_24475, partial [Burkholderia mallei]|nr:hypothetical protein [Burkholderia mallei]